MKTFWTVFFTSLIFGAIAGAQYPTNAPILGPDLRIASAISGGKLNLVGGNLVIDAGFIDTSINVSTFSGPLHGAASAGFDGGVSSGGQIATPFGDTVGGFAGCGFLNSLNSTDAGSSCAFAVSGPGYNYLRGYASATAFPSCPSVVGFGGYTYAQDTGTLYMCDGTNWHPMTLGLSAVPTASVCSSASVAGGSVNAFTVNVGTSCTVNAGTINLPTAPTGWVCACQNVTAPGSNVIGLTGGTASTCTITNYSRTTGTASNFTDSHVLRCTAFPY